MTTVRLTVYFTTTPKRSKKFSHIECGRFSVECRKTKTKAFTCPITKNRDNPVNQKLGEAIACNWRKARENISNILVLLQIGRESEVHFLNQSLSEMIKTKRNSNFFRHSRENLSTLSQADINQYTGAKGAWNRACRVQNEIMICMREWTSTKNPRERVY